MTSTTCDPPLKLSMSTATRRRGAATSIAVFVLIDALGWKYLEGRDFLNDWLPYRVPLRTVLGFSSGAIPTILTGEHPVKTGHWNLFYYDPKNSPFEWIRHFHFLPDRLLDNRVSRKLVQQVGRRVLGLGQLFDCAVSPRLLPWFNWVEKRNIYSQRGIAGAPSIFDRLQERRIPHRVYTYHKGTDAQLLRMAERDMSSGAASFVFLYLSEMDGFLHMHCKEEEAIEERLRWYESELRRLFTLARNLAPNVSLNIVSDHGMTPVKHRYDILQDIERLHLKMPDDYLAVYDSTMARFWFFNDRARSAIQGALNNIPCGRVLSEDELQRFGVLFEDRRFGETVFLLNPGWLFLRSDFNGTAWFPSGMHGYHPETDRYSDAIFLSNGQPEFPMQTIKDVFAHMSRAALELE